MTDYKWLTRCFILNCCTLKYIFEIKSFCSKITIKLKTFQVYLAEKLKRFLEYS